MPHILIVDDDPLNSGIAADALVNAGYACGCVENAEVALELLKWRRPDLLLLDQDMPGMSGGAMLRTLRTSENFYDLPVIMFTAVTGRQDEEQAIFAGAQDYIRKPFDPAVLVGRVQALLEKRASRPRHENLRTALEKTAGTWQDPEERLKRIL